MTDKPTLNFRIPVRIEEALDLLGKRATDLATGFTGVVGSISLDISGCVQALILPEASKEKTHAGTWFDVGRIKVGKRVLESPFLMGEAKTVSIDKGPTAKPDKR